MAVIFGILDIYFGLAIAAVALVLIGIIMLINWCTCWSFDYYKPARLLNSPDGGEKHINMQTKRLTSDGTMMQQVIRKSNTNGSMDRRNQNEIPYKTMDPETNTVRYDTAYKDDVKVVFDANDDSGMVGSAGSSNSAHGDGGSSIHASAEVHEVDERTGHTNLAVSFDEEPSRDNDEADTAQADYSMPPPPGSMPPPLTPNTPVTDLDAPDDFPPPPPTQRTEDLYASVDRRAKRQEEEEMVQNVWRPRSAAEIVIVEK